VGSEMCIRDSFEKPTSGERGARYC